MHKTGRTFLGFALGSTLILTLLLVSWNPNRAGEDRSAPYRTATLRTTDIFWSGIDLIDGSQGGTIQDREVKNAGKHIELGNYNEDAFSVGIQGGERGAIIDLGHWRDLAQQENYPETVGGGQGFASIHFRDGEMVILDRRNPNTYRRFERGNYFVDNVPVGVAKHAPARLGHIYLVRVIDQHDPQFELIAKILVVGGSRSGKQATIIWQVLERDEA